MTAQPIAKRPYPQPDRSAPGSIVRREENAQPTLVMECFSTGQPNKDAEEHASTLGVMILHEDMPTGLRAKHALDRLSAQPGIILHFVVKLWTFKMLRDPLLRGYAVTDARGANIFLLSLHGHLELPPTVCDLIDHWLADREEQPIALVVSLDESQRESAVAQATLEHLRAIAAASGVDLFPHFGTTSSTAWNWTSQEVPFQDDAEQTVLDLRSLPGRFQSGESTNSRLSPAPTNRVL